MRRSVEFMEWKASWWKSLIGKRKASMGVAAGLSAYALRQEYQFKSLAAKFTMQWKPLLSMDVLDTKELRKRRHRAQLVANYHPLSSPDKCVNFPL